MPGHGAWMSRLPPADGADVPLPNRLPALIKMCGGPDGLAWARPGGGSEAVSHSAHGYTPSSGVCRCHGSICSTRWEGQGARQGQTQSLCHTGTDCQRSECGTGVARCRPKSQAKCRRGGVPCGTPESDHLPVLCRDCNTTRPSSGEDGGEAGNAGHRGRNAQMEEAE